MTLGSYLWGMRAGTMAALIAFGAVVKYTDPERGGIVAYVLFYLTLFLAASGVFVLLFSGFRRSAPTEETAIVRAGAGFREGMLLGLLVILILLLQQFRVLTWWDGLLAVAGVFLIELYFLTK